MESKKLKEAGRSMVEIISVLAMMGVLSVSGIFGYKYAIKKHHQNQLKYETTIAAIDISSQMLAGKEPTFAGKEVLGYSMSLTSAPYSSAFEGTTEELIATADEGEWYDNLPSAGDPEFALEIKGLTPELIEFLIKWAAEAGAVQRIVDQSGDTITLEKLQDYQKLSDKSGVGQVSLTIYIIYKSDMSLKDQDELREIVQSGEDDSCSGHGVPDLMEGTLGCTCDKGWSGKNCSEQKEACSGHGSWFQNTLGLPVQMCICDKNWTGSYCEGGIGYSPCQTLEMKDGKEVRGFKAKGTSCEQSGVKGSCDGKGSCVPPRSDCVENADCKAQEFCHFLGAPGGNGYNCEKVRPKSFEYEGDTYYYNSDEDLRSWCRAADGQINCTWGFLDYGSAHRWCDSLGAELVDADFVHQHCEVFKEHLPEVMDDQQYWVKNLSTVHLGNPKDSCSIQKMVRSDGYAEAAGVVCVKKAQPDTSGCTSYKDCNEREYCALEYWCDCPFGYGYERGSCRPERGTCTPINAPKPENIEGIGYTWLGNPTNWYAANDWCQAMGKELVSIEDIGCYVNKKGTITKLNTGDSKTGFCCSSDGSCSNWPDLDNTGYSPVMSSLTKAYGRQTEIWTSSTLGTTKSNSCRMFSVGTNGNTFDSIRSYSKGSRPLCKSTVVCPEGGIPEMYEGHVRCCKDGYAWNDESKSYDYVAPGWCGCPDGGEKTYYPREEDYFCCKDGMSWSYGDKKYSALNLMVCNCPAGGTKVPYTTAKGFKDAMCCQNGHKYSAETLAYSEYAPSTCGCPEGGSLSEDGTQCCQKGYAWNNEKGSYSDITPSCGCPGEGTEQADSKGVTHCCKDNLAWNSEKMDYTDSLPDVCGCPAEGTKQLNSNGVAQCCKDDFGWDSNNKAYVAFVPDPCGYTDEGQFLFEMREIQAKLGNIDKLGNQKRQLENYRDNYEPLVNSGKATELERAKYEYASVILDQYGSVVTLLTNVKAIADMVVRLGEDLTKENLEEIQKLKKLYDEQHYVQQLQKALGLEGFVLFSEKPSISFLSFTNFVKELLGVKTAYAGTASNAACAFPIIGLYDSAVGLTSSGLSSALEAMSFSDAGQVCRNVLEYAKVGANLDRIANACPIVGAVNRHLSLDNFLTSTYTFFVSCRDCMSGQTYVAGYGCCPSDEEDRCKCIAEGGVYIGDCCHKKDGTIDCSSLSFTKDFVNDMKKISNTLTGFFSQED